MIKIRYSIQYYKKGAFILRFSNNTYYGETCKELAGNRRNGSRCLRYYFPNIEKKIGVIQEYFNLLKFNKKIELEEFIDTQKTVGKVVLVSNLKNIVEFEIAAIIIKTVCSGTLDEKPVSLDSLTGKYFTVRVKAILKNVPRFLERLSNEMLEKCRYNFDSKYGHGGLVNWSSREVFSKKEN